MQHRWNLYINQGERRIPNLIESGEIDLPCINPNEDSYQHRYNTDVLWGFLQHTQDMSLRGLYLSLTSTELPTFDGKQWFVYVACDEIVSGQTSPHRIVTWQDVKKLQLWNRNLREYANMYQVRGIMDYTTYVSRCFGYVFMLGLIFEDDDDDERSEFTNFYPSIHHYNAAVAINESNLWRPFNSDIDWISFVYDLPDSDNSVASDVGESVAALADAMHSVVEDISGTWSTEGNARPFAELVLGTAEEEDEDD